MGKGLSALIRTTPAGEQAEAPFARSSELTAAPGGVMHIEIARIRPNPFQPRADFDQQALDELKESIREKGIVQAVTVRRAE
ncbi:MAG TPA: ParB N-terminal domain-containing protein, partial [Bacteroidota bacterium]|nr:ParB N-terminal domain-containing protein [Bacteroidota bacterium]